MMLDVVVEAAKREVGEPPPTDVSGRDDLAAEKIGLLILAQHWHALVVGRERASQVDTEQALLEKHEGHRL